MFICRTYLQLYLCCVVGILLMEVPIYDRDERQCRSAFLHKSSIKVPGYMPLDHRVRNTSAGRPLARFPFSCSLELGPT